MNAGIFFTGTGPILLLTSFDSLTDENLIKKMESKGIKKFIAYQVDEEVVKQKYGNHYNVIMHDLKQADDLRVLDYDGHHIFNEFNLKDLGASRQLMQPVKCTGASYVLQDLLSNLNVIPDSCW